MKVRTLATAEELAREVAEEVAALVRLKHRSGGAILGLPTGATPLPLYRELERRRKEGGLDFSRVTVFTLDEYHGLGDAHPLGYHEYVRQHVAGPLQVGRWHIPSAEKLDGSELTAECRRYEELIGLVGGIDLQLLGIGTNGHIGFNEPGSKASSRTRLMALAESTRVAAARAFGTLEQVPTHGITMGIATILEAKRIIAMSVGPDKAAIAKAVRTAEVGERIPATYLRTHPQATLYLDAAAAASLSNVVT